MSPHEPTHVPSPRPRLLGRIAVTVIIALAVQGGVFWQVHRSAAAKRQQVALEMRDFEERAQELRAQMAALQGRLGQAQGEIDRLHEHASAQERAPRPAPIVLSPGCADTPLGC